MEIKSAELTEKNVESASVATAYAKNDFPVPGGPYNSIPLNGLRLPVNSCGNNVGIMTVYIFRFGDCFELFTEGRVHLEKKIKEKCG